MNAKINIMVATFWWISLSTIADDTSTQCILLQPKASLTANELSKLLEQHASVQIGRYLFTPLPVHTEGINLANRSAWIEQTIKRLTIPRIDFQNESVQDCLEFLRRVTFSTLGRNEFPDKHIHFGRLAYSEKNYSISLRANDLTVQQVLDSVAKQSNSQILITDYAVLLKELQKSDNP